MANLRLIYGERPKNVLERWEWPAIIYEGPANKMAAFMVNTKNEDYNDFMREARGLALQLCVFDYRFPDKPHRRPLRDRTFGSIREAMMFTQLWLDQNPTWQPKIV